MQVDCYNIKRQVPFCISKGLYKDELQESISEKTKRIFEELAVSRDNFQELRVTPSDTPEFLILMEFFWNTCKVKLSPVLNTKNKPVSMTAVRGSHSPNDLDAYYQFFTQPPKRVKKKRPAPEIKAPIPQKQIPLLQILNQKPDLVLGAPAQKPKPASPVPKISDQELRERFDKITAKRRYSQRRIGFGNLCYAQHGDPDCSKTMWSGALFYAVQENDLEKVKEILMNGEDPNAKDLDGKTPLFHVMHDPKMIRLLCNYGADPNISDNNGISPLMVARAYQVCCHVGDRFVKALVESGAKQ